MRVLIIEDEMMAQANLVRMLKSGFADMEIVNTIDSVRGAVDYLSTSPQLDVIFMDVELSDGVCFEIFRNVRVEVPVIIVTAYDSYAVKAFEAGSVDYLLKPVEMEALQRAVNRVRERKVSSIELEKILSLIGQEKSKTYKEKSIVRCGDTIIPVQASDIAFFFSEDKSNYLMTLSGERYMIESTLDTLEEELDPEKFFRISRGCIVSLSAIKKVSRNVLGKLTVITVPESPVEMTVARSRVDNFMAWLG